MEHEQDILVLRSKPDISVPTISYIHHECCTRVWEHDWWLKEVATLSGQFYSSVGGSEYGSMSHVPFPFLWKQDPVFVKEGPDIQLHTIPNVTSTTCWCTCHCTAVKASGLFWMETG